MIKDKEKQFFIIDFDSTLVRVETLDLLADIALLAHPEQKKVLEKIQHITKAGMEGKLSFQTSLATRLSLFSPTREHIDILVKRLKRLVTPSVLRNKAFFKKYASSIYIISGGFKDYIVPVVVPLGIREDHVIANTFVYNKKGMVTGFDRKNPLAQNGGKGRAIKRLKLSGEIVIVGDGYTDWEVKEAGIAHSFVAFTENVRRVSVVAKADVIVPNLDEFLYRHHLPRTFSYPKNRMRALFLERIDPGAADHFRKQGYQVLEMDKALTEEELAEAICDITILGIRSRSAITPKIIEKANRLLSIGAFCIGTNHIDLASCANKGVAVFNAPYSNTRSVVELVLGEIIMLARRAFDKNDKLHQGIWDKSVDGCFEIRGKALGIVGYGNIGAQLSVLAESMGMKVYFFDIADKLTLGNATRCQTLTQLLKLADIVTIHVDGSAGNRGLIGEREFRLMKDGVLFLNLSRGFVVDVDALARAIKSGKVAGAAVDVFPKEPKANDERFVSELQGLPNVILTPHIGGNTYEAQGRIADYVSSKLVSFIDTGDTTLSVNFPNLTLPALGRAHRFLHIHKNVPGVLAGVNNIMAKRKMNILGQYLATRGEIGYVITDVNKTYSEDVVKELRAIPETIRLRVLY